MKRYKLTEKGKTIIECIKYILISGVCAFILMWWAFIIGIYVISIMGYIL